MLLHACKKIGGLTLWCAFMQRFVLWQRRNTTVEPFNETVQQVTSHHTECITRPSLAFVVACLTYAVLIGSALTLGRV